MKLDNRNKTFTIKEAIIVYQLRICNQKTTNVTTFQAHFGRKPITPLSNISTLPKSSNLSNENILHHYFDADTVPVEDYLDENGWMTGDRSNILIEEAMQKAQVDAGRRYNGNHNKSISRSIMHLKLNNPIPRTEQSWTSNWLEKQQSVPNGIFADSGKPWPRVVQLSVLLIPLRLLRNQEYPRSVSEIVILPNSAPVQNEIQTSGNTPNEDPCHMRKLRRRRFLNTLRK